MQRLESCTYPEFLVDTLASISLAPGHRSLPMSELTSLGKLTLHHLVETR